MYTHTQLWRDVQVNDIIEKTLIHVLDIDMHDQLLSGVFELRISYFSILSSSNLVFRYQYHWSLQVMWSIVTTVAFQMTLYFWEYGLDKGNVMSDVFNHPHICQLCNDNCCAILYLLHSAMSNSLWNWPQPEPNWSSTDNQINITSLSTQTKAEETHMIKDTDYTWSCIILH